jgi:ketosteroid isomerase-like protein
VGARSWPRPKLEGSGLDTRRSDARTPNVEIVRRGYDAFNNGDTSALAALIAENVIWHVPGRSPIAGDYHGRETTFAYLHHLHEFTNGTYQTELHVAVGDDEHVISVRHSSARRNGRTYDENELVVFRFRDGRIAEAWQAFMSPYAHDAFFSYPEHLGGEQ